MEIIFKCRYLYLYTVGIDFIWWDYKKRTEFSKPTQLLFSTFKCFPYTSALIDIITVNLNCFCGQVRIMAFLRERDLGAAAAVSRNWRKAATHSSVRRALSFCRTCVDRVCRVLRSAPLLETVSFIRIPEVATAVRQLCRYTATET